VPLAVSVEYGGLGVVGDTKNEVAKDPSGAM
jgi:hypothetical protein